MQASITVRQAAQLIGISQGGAYKAIREGTFPTPVIKTGGRITVPTKQLLDLLGLDELPNNPVEAATC